MNGWLNELINQKSSNSNSNFPTPRTPMVCLSFSGNVICLCLSFFCGASFEPYNFVTFSSWQQKTTFTMSQQISPTPSLRTLPQWYHTVLLALLVISIITFLLIMFLVLTAAIRLLTMFLLSPVLSQECHDTSAINVQQSAKRKLSCYIHDYYCVLTK